MKKLLGVLASFLFFAAFATAAERARPDAKSLPKKPAAAQQAQPQFKLNLRLPSLSSGQQSESPRTPSQTRPLVLRPIRVTADNDDPGRGCVPWWVCGGECDPQNGC